jgi:Tfp pilus assembly protein PilO
MQLGTPTATKVTGAIGLVVVAALGWTLAAGPETGRLADAREQVTQIQDQNSLLATQLAGLVKQQAQLGDTRNTARILARKFPPTADQPGLFQMVTAAAVEAGIGADGVTTLTPTPPVVGSADPAAAATDPAATPTAGGVQVARQTVTVSVAGSYDQTQQLLVNLENMDRAYLVTSVSLAGDAESGVFTTTITGEMFVMPPVKDPGKTVEVSSTTTEEGS